MEIVFESVKERHHSLIKRLLKRNIKIWVIEPFNTFHHNKEVYRFFPSPLPEFVLPYIKEEKICLISAESLASRRVYGDAAEKAVATIASIWPHYAESHQDLLDFVKKTLQDSTAENAFKIIWASVGKITSSLGPIYVAEQALSSGFQAFELSRISIATWVEYRPCVHFCGIAFVDSEGLILPVEGSSSAKFGVPRMRKCDRFGLASRVGDRDGSE